MNPAGQGHAEPRLPYFRVCAVCLDYIVRADYDDHMRDRHGYTLLIVMPVDGPRPASDD